MKAGQSQWVTPWKVVPCAHAPKLCVAVVCGLGEHPGGAPVSGPFSLPGRGSHTPAPELAPDAGGGRPQAAPCPTRDGVCSPCEPRHPSEKPFPLAGRAICPRTVTTTATTALLCVEGRWACLIDSLTRRGLILGPRSPHRNLPWSLSRPAIAGLSRRALGYRAAA